MKDTFHIKTFTTDEAGQKEQAEWLNELAKMTTVQNIWTTVLQQDEIMTIPADKLKQRERREEKMRMSRVQVIVQLKR